MVATAHGNHREPGATHAGRAVAHFYAAHGYSHVRGIHPEEIRRRKNIFIGRLGESDSFARPRDRKSRRTRHRTDCDGNGASWTTQCAGKYYWQKRSADLS